MNINKKNKIHIIGIGGIGMSGIAEILFGMGYKVQGSDITKSKNVLRLNKKKIKVYIGHKKQNIKKSTILVISSAIKKKIQSYYLQKKEKSQFIKEVICLLMLFH